MTSGIYRIENKQDEMEYIGSAVNIEKRWRKHRFLLRGNRHDNIHLQRAWNKYGEDSFVFTVLEEVNTDELLIVEQKHLDALFIQGNCYNIALNAVASMLGCTHTDDARRKMSEAQMGNQRMRGYKHTDETRHNMSLAHMNKQTFLGHKHTQETRRKISEAKKGHIVSDETRRKISEALAGNQNALGCKHVSTDEGR